MQVQLITPEKILFEGEAAYIQIPGTEGEFGVMPEHAPVVSTIKEGTIGIELTSGEKKDFPVLRGIAEVIPERCILLVEVNNA